MKIEVGQVLYREIQARNSPTEIREYTVSKIGNKFLYLKEDDRYPINKKNLKYETKNYSQNNFQLYTTKQEILDEREREKLTIEIKKIFSAYGKLDLSLGQLRAIKDIIENKH